MIESQETLISSFAPLAMGKSVPGEDDDGGGGRGSSPLHAFAAEATALAEGDDTELSREERARKALECDCVADLRDGPCGQQFSEAFYCFLTSAAEDQGSDCIKPFIAMQTCMASNPEAFVIYTGEDRDETNAGGESPGKDKQGPSPASPPPGAIKNPIE